MNSLVVALLIAAGWGLYRQMGDPSLSAWRRLSQELGFVGDEHQLSGRLLEQPVRLTRQGPLVTVVIDIPGAPLYQLHSVAFIRCADGGRPTRTLDGPFDNAFRAYGSAFTLASLLDHRLRRDLLEEPNASVMDGKLTCPRQVLGTVDHTRLIRLVTLAKRLQLPEDAAAALADSVPLEQQDDLIVTRLRLLADRSMEHALAACRELWRARPGTARDEAEALLLRHGTEADRDAIALHRRGLDPSNIGAVSFAESAPTGAVSLLPDE